MSFLGMLAICGASGTGVLTVNASYVNTRREMAYSSNDEAPLIRIQSILTTFPEEDIGAT